MSMTSPIAHRAHAGMVVRAADASTVDDGPTSAITLLVDRGASSPLTVNRASLQVGSPGAPPHLHHDATETFYVLGGIGQILIDDAIHDVAAGDFVLVPPGVVHAFAPTADHELELLVSFSNGRPRFDYYRLLERVFHGAATIADIAASGPQFDNYYVDNALWKARWSGAGG